MTDGPKALQSSDTVKAPALPSDEAIFEITEKGRLQLHGSSTELAAIALRFLVLVDGKLGLGQIASHMKDVPRPRLNTIVLSLEKEGYVQPVKAGEPDKPAAFDVLDFFSGRSPDERPGSPVSDQEAARKLEAEEQNFSALLKAQGYAVRIARRVNEAVKPASGGNYSVLFVDDEPTLSSAVCKFLELEGFTPRRAANRSEVVQELRKPPLPDLILLDVMLPDVSGFDILQRVRGHAALKHIPIIMLTGKATREDVMFALSAGANGYITKPFEFESLTTSIRAVLGLGDEN